MGNPLTSTVACKQAGSMALEKARLGLFARIVMLRRASQDSFDLAYTVRGANGTEKSVVVTERALRMRLRRLGLVSS